MKERNKLILLVAAFSGLLRSLEPSDHPAIGLELILMLQEYAQQHVLTCSFGLFIAGAIAVFVSQASVLKYFGVQPENRLYSWLRCREPLAVCSCTVLPVRRDLHPGAGIGRPRLSVLRPAINVWPSS
jgi:uncharacterized membrane protein YraQ (UPF0718 family)